MSSSLYSDCGGYYDIPQSYLVYNNGDKTFSELCADDTIYYYNHNICGDIVEIKLKSAGTKKRNGEFYLSIEPVKVDRYYKVTKLVFGSCNGSRYFGEINGEWRSYNPGYIDESSVCVGVGGEIFGTNKDSVINFAKAHIDSQISKMNDKMKSLQNTITALNDRLSLLDRDVYSNIEK